MKINWVLFTASRYIFKGRSNSPVLAVLGIAVGVLALIVIIAVMNGFQLGFIESILEISSFHIRIESFEEDKIDLLAENAAFVPSVRSVIPFKEYQAIARGNRKEQQSILVRGLKENALEIDAMMADKIRFEEGSFDLSQPGSVLLGSMLAQRLGVFTGDEVTIFSLAGLLSSDEERNGTDTYTVTGIFVTEYYEYDCSWAILNINDNSFNVNECSAILGIKINNRFNDKITLEQIKKQPAIMREFENLNITSWRDYNRSFFGALRTEKLFMFILVGLIFIVVGLNIFQAQRRTVLQRREEIGLLRAVGGTQNAVRFIFVCDGAIIGLTGACLGLACGLGIAFNIQSFFTIVENIVNSVIRVINFITGYFGSAGAIDNFAIFSPAVFYLKEIPARIIPVEVLIIFMFGFLSALVAGWFASRKIIKIQPAEVLRYE